MNEIARKYKNLLLVMLTICWLTNELRAVELGLDSAQYQFELTGFKGNCSYELDTFTATVTSEAGTLKVGKLALVDLFGNAKADLRAVISLPMNDGEAVTYRYILQQVQGVHLPETVKLIEVAHSSTGSKCRYEFTGIRTELNNKDEHS